MTADDDRDEDPRHNDRSDDDEDRPRRRRDDSDNGPRRPRHRPEPVAEPTEFLIPVGVSGYSLAACYLGLVGCMPVIGLPFGIIALVCGIIALRQRKKKQATGSYGAVTSDMRAVIGVVLGGISVLLNLPLAILVIIGALHG